MERPAPASHRPLLGRQPSTVARNSLIAGRLPSVRSAVSMRGGTDLADVWWFLNSGCQADGRCQSTLLESTKRFSPANGRPQVSRSPYEPSNRHRRPMCLPRCDPSRLYSIRDSRSERGAHRGAIRRAVRCPKRSGLLGRPERRCAVGCPLNRTIGGPVRRSIAGTVRLLVPRPPSSRRRPGRVISTGASSSDR